MGCDIHMYIERKVNGKWININPLVYGRYSKCERRFIEECDVNRDYELFAWLAQVRDECTCGFQPKGFPKDASKETKEDYEAWGSGAHSPSFLTLKELKNNININPGYVTIQFVDNVLDEMESHASSQQAPRDEECVRIVFWFDN